MAEFEQVARPDVETTKATAHMPGLDIEITHRRSPGGDGEQISVTLTATPSFEAFVHLLEIANPFAFWAEGGRLAWIPWLEAARAMMPVPLALSFLGSDVSPSRGPKR
jgi:hypothetical protein